MYVYLLTYHTSNNVEATGNIVDATFDFVEATFDFVAKNGNNVERFFCKISSFRQSRNKWTWHLFNLFRLSRKDEISFDIVAQTGNNVEAAFDVVERIVQLVAFDNVASTLLLVWTWLKSTYWLCSRRVWKLCWRGTVTWRFD